MLTNRTRISKSFGPFSVKLSFTFPLLFIDSTFHCRSKAVVGYRVTILPSLCAGNFSLSAPVPPTIDFIFHLWAPLFVIANYRYDLYHMHWPIAENLITATVFHLLCPVVQPLRRSPEGHTAKYRVAVWRYGSASAQAIMRKPAIGIPIGNICLIYCMCGGRRTRRPNCVLVLRTRQTNAFSRMGPTSHKPRLHHTADVTLVHHSNRTRL